MALAHLDGISVLPTFDPGKRSKEHAVFNKLIGDSKGQRLLSGLATLVWHIGFRLAQKLETKHDALLEYVLNQRDLWADARLAASEQEGEEEDEEDLLEKQVADLDVALLSLIEPLDTDVSQVATVLDEVLKDSLWKRTLAREEEVTRNIERELLRSRAEWLWGNSTPDQRRACFYSGLGRKPGLFLHDQLDALVDILCDFQSAVAADDHDAAGTAAVALYTEVMKEPFFAVRRLPEGWEGVLREWINGTMFAQILDGRGARDAHRAQVFVQEGVVFRLVWAAEAVRVQAVATDHARAGELGDGPAFALTYGVPSIPAALLCQMGFSSRVGAVWLTRQLGAAFTDMNGLRAWLALHNALLSDPDFWEAEDMFTLWTHTASPSASEYPRTWSRRDHTVNVNWKTSPLAPGSQVRIIPAHARKGTICSLDLNPLGEAQFPFDPQNAALDGSVTSDGKVQISYFGS